MVARRLPDGRLDTLRGTAGRLWRRASGLLLALPLAWALPAPACEPHVEALREPAHAVLRADRSALSRCTLSEADYRQVVGEWLASRGDDAPALASLALGRAVEHPWIARHLLEAAARSGEWTPRLARATAAEHNRFVARLLTAPEFLQRLDAPFAATAYRVDGVLVEKVLLGPPVASAPAPADMRHTLPYDAQLWLRLVRGRAAGGDGDRASPPAGGKPRRCRRGEAAECRAGALSAPLFIQVPEGVDPLSMRAQVEFVSADFPPYPGEDQQLNPGRYGIRLAEFLAQELPAYGFPVESLTVEMWGVRVGLQHADYPLWVGCGNYEAHENGFLCFIEPAKPTVRKWFRKLPNAPTVERLATAIESILQGSGKVSQLRWWSENELRRP